MPETNTQTEIFDSISDFLEAVQTASRGWNSTLVPRDLPSLPGLYVIYSEVNGICLYIGQSENLSKRILHHWAWKKAYYTYGLPHIAYKVIERNTVEETRRELIYNECLLVGLLRPEWNAAVPAPRSDFMPDSYEKLKVVHWSKLVEKHFEPFHPMMQSNEGYLVAKQVKIMTVSGRIVTKWRRVLYDRRYLDEFVKDLGNQIDTFFMMRETKYSPNDFLEENDLDIFLYPGKADTD